MQTIEKLNKTLLSKHGDLFSNVTVWDNGGLTMDRYTVVIGDDVWFMSSYPGYPNGVCMYGGIWMGDLEEPSIVLNELPIAVLEQIIVLAKEETCRSQ